MEKYQAFENKWNLSEWKSYCPQMEYRVKTQAELPIWFPENLKEKFNSAVVVCSACAESMVFIVNSYRIDKNDIDEHPFVVAFDVKTEKSYAGFIEHASYSGRTSSIPPEMKKLISISGIDINYKFERKPNKDKGTIAELQKEGKIKGIDKAVSIILNKSIKMQD